MRAPPQLVECTRRHAPLGSGAGGAYPLDYEHLQRHLAVRDYQVGASGRPLHPAHLGRAGPLETRFTTALYTSHCIPVIPRVFWRPRSARVSLLTGRETCRQEPAPTSGLFLARRRTLPQSPCFVASRPTRHLDAGHVRADVAGGAALYAAPPEETFVFVPHCFSFKPPCMR